MSAKPVTPPLQPVAFPSAPWQKLGIDIVGPFSNVPADCRELGGAFRQIQQNVLLKGSNLYIYRLSFEYSIVPDFGITCLLLEEKLNVKASIFNFMLKPPHLNASMMSHPLLYSFFFFFLFFYILAILAQWDFMNLATSSLWPLTNTM